MINSSPALGPEWIRHNVELYHPEHELRVVYGEPDDRPTLDELMKPGDSFIGFSCTTLSYRPIIPLMEEANRRDIPVMVGGAHARLGHKAILKNRPYAMVVPDAGENAVMDLLNGLPREKIRGMRYKGGPPAKQSPGAYETIPFLHQTIDYKGFAERFVTRSRKTFRDDSVDAVISVRGITGCTKTKACSFCAVQRVIPFDPVERARYMIAERRAIAREYGDNAYIRECSDSLPEPACLDAMGDVLEAQPMGNRVYCGGMVWELIDKDMYRQCRRAGYTDFLIGLESFYDQHFEHVFKPSDSIDMLFALLEKTKHEPVRFFVSGIVGWPGESETSLTKSLDVINRILEYPQVVSLSVNYLLALPGTAVFHDMVKLGAVNPEDDCHDLREVFQKNVELRCPDTNFDRLQRFVADAIEADSNRVVQYTGFVERTAA
jgi:radical SAM superfamily enzyme YgiQ (UPF0313 family)